MRSFFNIKPYFLAFLFIFLPLTQIGAGESVTFEKSAGILVTETGRFPLTLELAVTVEQRQQGLQYRPELADNAGMLFDFGRDMPVTMWMKNTLISLDMLFIDKTGRVVSIVRGTKPLSLDFIPSVGPVRYVLELNAGATNRMRTKPGDRLEHRIIGRK